MMGFLATFSAQDRILAQQDSLYTDYDHGLNTESWHGGFDYQKRVFSGFRLIVSESFTSSRLRVTPDEDKWKDQQHLLIDVSRRLSDRFSLNLMGSGLVFSDKQSGYQNDIRTHLVGLGATYRRRRFRIPVLAGMKDDRRFGQIDRGFHYRMGMDMPHFRLGDYHNRLMTAYEEDDFSKRKNTTLSASYLIHRQFYAGTYDSLMLSLNHQRRDYYVSESGIIESREEKSHRAENSLSYRFGSGFSCRIQGVISSRNLKIGLMNGPDQGLKRQRRDFRLFGIVRLLMKTPSFRGEMTLSHSSEEQKYDYAESQTSFPYSSTSLLSAPDNQNAYTTLSVRAGWRFFSTDSLSISSSIQRFRYDTPDLENYDDRDELRFWLDFVELHRFSPALTLRLSLHLNLHHFVYIYGQKSANNNWSRILRYGSTVFWQPNPRWRFVQSAEVLANYVDYDFESVFPSVRSFLYRKFRLEDSTRVELTERTSLHFHYRLELDENGKFLWAQWLEQKLIDRQSHAFTISLRYQPWPSFSISPGYTLYARKGNRYEQGADRSQQKEVMQDFRSRGPVLRVVYISDRLRFILSGSTIDTKTLTIDKQVYTRIDLSMNWNF